MNTYSSQPESGIPSESQSEISNLKSQIPSPETPETPETLDQILKRLDRVGASWETRARATLDFMERQHGQHKKRHQMRTPSQPTVAAQAPPPNHDPHNIR